MNFGIGQSFNPHSLRIYIDKQLDSEWYPENNLSIFNEMIHYSMQDRRIYLKKVLGKRTYKKIISKVKSLSR